MTERYEHSKHRPLVEAWLSERGMTCPPPEMFPPTGFVVDDVAVGFLHKTDSKQAYIDQVATKPGLRNGIREASLLRLIDELEKEARRSGYWLVVALPKSANMRARFSSLSFDSEGDFTLVHKTLLT